MTEYKEILRYFVENNECSVSGEMCKDCPITDTCNTPTDQQDAKDWLKEGEMLDGKERYNNQY